MSDPRPDVILILTDEERAAPPYETDELRDWRKRELAGQRWFADHGVSFGRHYTGSLACVPSRPTLFTGQYPDVHGVTQTDGLGKMWDDTRMRWLRPGEVPTLGHWFRAAGYDTHYDGKWHISHADLTDPATGGPLATNDAHGTVDRAAEQAYLDADPLDAFGFSGWVGPEPHGAPLANAGVRRDPLIADRVVAWLEDRYARRRAGDADASRPFLLVASFVNPHDIVLFPAWVRRGAPLNPATPEPPPVPPSPTADEDLATKPAAQIAYRNAYPSAYGPARLIERAYRANAQQYRDLYYRLHAEVDAPLNRVRRAVTDGGSEHAVLVRTSDHGDLLGAHGGLHQKWYNLYDEATRVPFQIARIGDRATTATPIEAMATCHVDVVPTLLSAAGIDTPTVEAELADRFSEVHPLPGRDLMGVVDGAEPPDADRVVYMLTRDAMLEGDTGASGIARARGMTENPPAPLRIQLPAHVGTNVEGIVTTVAATAVAGGGDHRWKLVRTFDDPATWTEPHVRHLAATGPGGPAYRTEPLPDQWELYDLADDPIEAVNRWNDPDALAVFDYLRGTLAAERLALVPARNEPWPYASTTGPVRPFRRSAPPPARALRKVLQRAGLHPDDVAPARFDLAGRRALVIATNHGTLDVGKPTGVFASEMTVPYYGFLDAGMEVDVASPSGGIIPVDPLSVKPVIRTAEDDRFLADDDLRNKVTHSLPVAELDMDDYDLVFLAGGWGAAFDFATSQPLADAVTAANAADCVIGGVCHGPLGMVNAVDGDGSPLVAGRHVTAVTDKQVNELGISATPYHPERGCARPAPISRAGPPAATCWPTTGWSTATWSPARTRTRVRWWRER